MTPTTTLPNPPPDEAELRSSEKSFRLLVESVSDYAIFMLDSEGRVASWNAGAQRIKGYRPEEIIGQSFERFYPPEKVAEGWPREELRRAIANGRIEDEGWRVRKDGSRFWASVVITALRDPRGRLQGFAKVTRDLTERRKQEEELRRSEEQLRLMLEAVKDYALFMLDTSGRVLTWNAGATAIMGYTASEVLSCHFSMFFPQNDVAAGRPEQELGQALRTGRAELEEQRVRKDGSLFWANVIITPVLDRDGVLRGFAKVTRDLTEQRRLLELERASRHMNEFIAMLAHELRNPLAPIRNAVNVLRMQPDLPPVVDRMGDMIDRQARQLTRLVDDLLDVGRIATGKISLQRQDLDYREIVLASAEAARPLMAAKRHQLQVEVAEHIPMRGDPTRLAQVLHNLLSNAARYTPEGGEVILTATVVGSRSITRVLDNGQGIAPEALESIFGLFEQEHGVERNPSESSLGIGLTLARTLTELHGGSLTAHSEGRGRGASFELVLPCQPSSGTREAGRGSAPQRADDMRVLVVDDNHDSADSMVMLLEQLGHEAHAAYGSEQALQLAGTVRPTLILLDLNMPGEGGFEIIQRLRARLEHPVYIAAMTGYGQRADRERTRGAGFDEHLTKPVALDPLVKVIQRAARRASAS
ncbi:hybrid sensor histidine kinase/response regulator [Ideonella sp. YS5]|uniref:PAS domain-containing hybrid sensor histidine kinase/response regulator n=1 Tax=Ideonella sp. YS5 TaxID=3453714 RepID=UPI003EEDEE55